LHYESRPQQGLPYVSAPLCGAGQTHALRAWLIRVVDSTGTPNSCENRPNGGPCRSVAFGRVARTAAWVCSYVALNPPES
jgi:hypothetical protein